MPRNRLGAKALNVVLGHPRDAQQVTLWVKIGKILCAIGLDLSARICGVLSDGLDGAIAMEGLKLRGSRRCEPAAQMQNGRSFDLPLLKFWWRVRDSNPGHKDYDSSALTD